MCFPVVVELLTGHVYLESAFFTCNLYFKPEGTFLFFTWLDGWHVETGTLLLHFIQDINRGVPLPFCALGHNVFFFLLFLTLWLIHLKLKWLMGRDLFPLHPTGFCVWLQRGKKWPVGRFQQKGVWTCLRPVRPAGVSGFAFLRCSLVLDKCYMTACWRRTKRHSASAL